MTIHPRLFLMTDDDHFKRLTFRGIGGSEFQLWTLLARVFCRGKNYCWPSQSLLAERMGRSREWINKLLQKLESAGEIRRVEDFVKGRYRMIYIVTYYTPYKAERNWRHKWTPMWNPQLIKEVFLDRYELTKEPYGDVKHSSQSV